MAKRVCLALMLGVALLMMLPTIASADTLIEPNNDFYYRHSDECQYLNRSFYVNHPDGSVKMLEEPGSRKEVATIPNGEVLLIMFTYNHRGEIWGVADYRPEGVAYNLRSSGWIPMDQLLLVYDAFSFADEYGHKFTGQDKEFDTTGISGEIVLWAWPGSGEIRVSISAEYLAPSIFCSEIYIDEEGREWGYISYYQGIRDSWVCLDAPTDRGIPAFHAAPDPTVWVPKEEQAPASRNLTPLLVGGGVLAVAVGTAILIRALWRPRRARAS